MPLTPFQTDLLRTIAVNRSPDSYLAGATVLHRADKTPRFSHDLDFFHDIHDAVAQSAAADEASLLQAGYSVEWTIQAPTFQRAVVSLGTDKMRIEWAQDSAFRFFPVQEDKICGYRLHDTDAAINKTLALAGRQEIRDFVDVLHLHETYLTLGTMAWAACGKDPGFTPDFLLENAGRHVAYTQRDLERLDLSVPLDLKDLKKRWLAALEEARSLVQWLPASELGCLYLSASGQPISPDPSSDQFASLARHVGTIRGAWPTVGP